MKNNKMRGYVYTLEVVVAISIIVLSLFLIFGAPPAKPELEISIIRHQGFDALEHLDQKDQLRTSSDQEIENQLRPLLPETLQLTLDNTTLPNRTVIAVDYYISTHKDDYLGKKITLWLWEEIQ